jgi:hypothetical protein
MCTRFVALLAGPCILLIAGCPALVSLVPGQFLPAEPDPPPIVEFVAANEALFEAGSGDQLAMVAPGTVLDGLDRLDGCWGSILKQPSSDNPLVTVVAVHRFDAAASAFEQWSYLRDATGSFFVLTLERGTFEIAEDNLLTLRFEEHWSNDPDTGELVAEDAEPREFPALVTVRDDEMLFVVGAKSADGLAPEDYVFYLFKRFECVP